MSKVDSSVHARYLPRFILLGSFSDTLLMVCSRFCSLEGVKEKLHTFIGMCFLFICVNTQILNLCHIYHKRIHNSLKYLKWRVLRNCFRKTLHPRRLTGFWVCLWMTHQDLVNMWYCENELFSWFANNSKLKQNWSNSELRFRDIHYQ